MFVRRVEVFKSQRLANGRPDAHLYLPDSDPQFKARQSEDQRELKLRRREIPIIFITANPDKTVRLRLLEQGAVECLFNQVT